MERIATLPTAARLAAFAAALPLMTGLAGCERIRSTLGLGGGEQASEDGAEGSAPTAGDPTTPPTDAANPDDAVIEDSTPTGGSSTNFRDWTPLHALLVAPILGGAIASDVEAIVWTRDDHVGVTRDGGDTWVFHKLLTGSVLGAAGNTAGPYVVVGRTGFAAISPDGNDWHELARQTDEDLGAVVVGSFGIVALSKKGRWVRYDMEGRPLGDGEFPDKARPGALMVIDGKAIAVAGKTGYISADGEAWSRWSQTPPPAAGKAVMTPAGLCKIGKFGGAQGVVCSVDGLAFGLDERTAVVLSGTNAFTTVDAGLSWKPTVLPIKGAAAVFGSPGKAIYVLGSGGMVARSTDAGSTWTAISTGTGGTLRAGLVDGDIAVVVGDKGSVARSSDGGATFAQGESPIRADFQLLTKGGGGWVATGSKGAIASRDSAAWEEVEIEATLPAAPTPCTELPAAGTRCRYSAQRTTPEDLPNVRGFAFRQTTGLAWGERGLAAMSGDGGRTWTARAAVDVRGVRAMDVAGADIVVTDGKTLFVSHDAGTSYAEGKIVGNVDLADVAIMEDGRAFAVGRQGTILRSSLDLNLWPRTVAVAGDKANYFRVYEVAGAIYVAGLGGELRRTSDGDAWATITTGVRRPVVAMTGAGETLFAIVAGDRKTGNLLLRSDDAGQHFWVVDELQDTAFPHDLRYDGETLRLRNKISADGGRTWRQAVEAYWPGAVDVGDGSGKRLYVELNYATPDTLYMVGDTRDDWLLMEDVFCENGRLECDAQSGCWMITSEGVFHAR